MESFPFLSLVVFLPVLASLLVFFVPKEKTYLVKHFTLVVCLAEFVLTGYLVITHLGGNKAFSLTEKADWITLPMGNMGILSVDYYLEADGVSLSLLLLSSIVFTVAAISSYSIREKTQGYNALFLLLFGAIMGCFVALDFFLFYLFFEFMLLPMYFLIGLWGGPRREYAAIKFFLYTLLGSVLILIVMIGLYLSAIDPVETANLAHIPLEQVQEMLKSGDLNSSQLVHTFRLDYLYNPENYIPGSVLHPLNTLSILGHEPRFLAYMLLLIGFLIKLPAVPFHTWLPDAHVEAPTPISVLLAGLLLKVGAYGLYRLAIPLFPEMATRYAWLLALVGTVSILYAAYNALAAHDLKKMIAYSSVSHMGFVALGFAAQTPEAVIGAIFQLFSHGLLSAMLFLLAGVLYDRTHDREIGHYRGLANQMPLYCAMVVVAFFASLGLPAFSGFIAEVFVLLGAFRTSLFSGAYALAASFGLLLGAGYLLWTLQRMFFGRFWVKESLLKAAPLKDLTTREKIMLYPLAFCTLTLGIFPGMLIQLYSTDVERWIGLVQQHTYWISK